VHPSSDREIAEGDFATACGQGSSRYAGLEMPFDAQEQLAHLGQNYHVGNAYLHCHHLASASLAAEGAGEDLQSFLMVRDGGGGGQ
jgi:hypothetical protein